jgi:hypothetical protein
VVHADAPAPGRLAGERVLDGTHRRLHAQVAERDALRKAFVAIERVGQPGDDRRIARPGASNPNRR